MVISERLAQMEKALSPMFVTLFGIVIPVSVSHPYGAAFPIKRRFGMVVILSGRTMETYLFGLLFSVVLRVEISLTSSAIE
jgi:hypothetical protein